MTTTHQTPREKRLARNERIRQQNRERAAANELRLQRFMTTVVMDGYKPEGESHQTATATDDAGLDKLPLPPKNAANPGWLICPSCDCGITATDIETGECTNCGQTLL